MDIYTLLWLLIIFVLFTQHHIKSSTISKLFWIIAVFMIALVAFRADNIGGDTYTYRQIFLNPDYYDGFSDNEIILPAINAVLRIIWINVHFASIVKAMLILAPIFILIKKRSSNSIYSLFLFVTYSYGGSMYLLTFSAERQCIAMAFFCMFLLLYTNIKKNNLQLMILLVCMVLTHSSSVLGLLFLPFSFLRLNKLIISALTILSILTGFFIGNYIDALMIWADSYDKSFYLSNYGNYDTNFLMLLPFYLPYYIALYYWPKNKLNDIWFVGFTLCVMATGILQTVGQNIERMSAYYYICAFIAIPQALSYIPHMKVRLFYIIFILLYFSRKYFLILQVMSEVENGIYPYKTFF